jgi:Tol biopolymer transport system component
LFVAVIALLALLAAFGCDTSQVTEPTSNGVIWTRITDAATAENPFFPDWRGDTIAFEYFDPNGVSRHALIHEEGQGLRYLAGGFFITSDRYPRWVSDSIIVFSTNRTGVSYDIWYRSTATGTVRALTAFSANEWDPAPRPGQPALAYCEGASPVNGRITLIADTVRANVNRTYLTPSGLRAGEVAWNPAGDKIAFSAADSGQDSRHIWVATLAPGDTSLTQLTTGPVHDYSPHWSPDGTRIYFTSDRTARSGVWWVNPAGEGAGLDVVAFEDKGASIVTLGVSPDGTKIAISSDGRGLGRAIWVLSNLP